MILIVDDDSAVASGLEKLLRFAGFEAVAVNTATEALSLLGLRRPKLIVLDLHMPLMDGLTLLRAIRADKSFNAVPIAIHTSDFSMETEARALAAGAQAYFIKGTLGWDSLLDRIKGLLDPGGPMLRYVD